MPLAEAETRAAVAVDEESGRDGSGEVIIHAQVRNADNAHPIAQHTDGRAVLIKGSMAKAPTFTRLSDGALSVRVTDVRLGTVDTGCVDGSVWLSGCTGCIIRTQCRQLRVHDSSACAIFAHVLSAPIVERCSALRFGPLRRASGQGEGEGRWREVVDMSWLRGDRSDNWCEASVEDEDEKWLLQSIPKSN